MPRPKLQHFLPESFLRGFVDRGILERDGKERIWVYEKGKPIRLGAPKSEACRRDYYSLIAGGQKDDRIEHALACFESDAMPLIRHVATDRVSNISSDYKRKLAYFAGLMYARVPATREFLARLAAEYAKKCLDDAENDSGRVAVLLRQHSLGKEVPRERRVEIVSEVVQDLAGWNAETELTRMLSLSTKVGEALTGYLWEVHHADEENAFITSDTPIATMVPDGYGDCKVGPGFMVEGTFVFWPIASTCCLVMHKHSGFKKQPLRNRDVHFVNRLLMSTTQRFIYYSDKSEKLRASFEKYGGRVKYFDQAFIPEWRDRPELLFQ
ncbi:MAG: DUF4238 domain-containing protein [Terriglobales bacterium]